MISRIIRHVETHQKSLTISQRSKFDTRMHSSRMRTVRSSSRLCSRGAVPAGGVSGGVYLPRGCTWSGGYLPRYSPHVKRMTDRCKKHNLRNFVADGKHILTIERLTSFGTIQNKNVCCATVTATTVHLKLYCGVMQCQDSV